MKKIILAIMFCMMFTCNSFAKEKYVVRNVYWGMSKNEIINSEKGSNAKFISSDENTVIYDVQIKYSRGSVPCRIVYFIRNEKLIMVDYNFKSDKNIKRAKSVAKELMEAIEKKYKRIRTISDNIFYLFESKESIIKFRPHYNENEKEYNIQISYTEKGEYMERMNQVLNFMKNLQKEAKKDMEQF